MQVTSKNIGLLPDGRYTIETNLQVRVTKSKASFIFRYQFAGRWRDLSLGSHPTVTVTAAKQEAAKCRALLARGIAFRCQSRASRRARQASARLCKLRGARARNDLRAQAPVRSDQGVLARTDEESHPASAQAQTSRRHHGAGHLRSARPTVGKEDDNRIEDPWTAGSDLHAREA